MSVSVFLHVCMYDVCKYVCVCMLAYIHVYVYLNMNEWICERMGVFEDGFAAIRCIPISVKHHQKE